MIRIKSQRMTRMKTNKNKILYLCNSCHSRNPLTNSLINLFMIFCYKESKNGLQTD